MNQTRMGTQPAASRGPLSSEATSCRSVERSGTRILALPPTGMLKQDGADAVALQAVEQPCEVLAALDGIGATYGRRRPGLGGPANGRRPGLRVAGRFGATRRPFFRTPSRFPPYRPCPRAWPPSTPPIPHSRARTSGALPPAISCLGASATPPVGVCGSPASAASQ